MDKITIIKGAIFLTSKCSKCNTDIDNSAQFCPNCGTKCERKQEWICAHCQTKNSAEANFCKQCGKSSQPPSVLAQKLQVWSSSPYAKYIIGLIILLLITGLGSYYYFNFVSESHYLAQYAEAARKIETANDLLTSNIKPDTLTREKTADLQKQLQEQKNNIDSVEKDFSHSHPLQKYAEQHKNLINLLNKESSILEETCLIITKPLDSGTDTVLNSLKENVDEATSLAGQIQVPNTNFSLINDMSLLPHHLTLFVEEQRKINKDKLDRLALMNTFFQKTDAIIQRYDGAKTDLSGLLGNIRNGGYTWFDYFQALQSARSFRLGIRSEIDRLNAPKGTEALKRQFSEVLTASLLYCDQMNAAAQIEFNSNLSNAQKKYTEATAINTKVQNSYADFINTYQSEKTRLTNMDNL